MANFTISDDNGDQRTLKSGETGTVTDTGDLTLASTAVRWDLTGGAGTATLINDGIISDTSGRAIDTTGNASSAQSLSIVNSGSISGSSDFARIQGSLKGGSISIDNSGAIAGGTGRGINVQEFNQLGGFTLTNHAGATFQSQGDVIRLTSGTSGATFTGTLLIDNSGTIKSTGTGDNNGQALDLADLAATEAGHIHIINRATGRLEAGDADAVRTGDHALIDNYGVIQSKNANADSSGNDGIDLQSNVGVVTNNHEGGEIISARHGITGDNPATVTNDGTITGQQGAGINMDSGAATVTTIVNNATGVITGTATAATDGDGVDIDGLVDLTNHGRIEAVGTYADGLGEALAIGGGTVFNDGTIISDQRAITVDDSDLGEAFAALDLVNAADGVITGANGEAIFIAGARADTIVNAGTINGSVATGGGDDAISNSGLINGALDTGAGDDVVRWIALLSDAVDGGADSDTLIFDATFDAASGGAHFSGFENVSGRIVGGDGDDVLDLSALLATGTLSIAGAAGDDSIIGGAANETINGGSGDDRINGGAGKDVLTGGAGADLFILDWLNAAGQHDQIKDFVSGTDQLQLSATAFAALADYGPGALDLGELAYGKGAKTADQHLIFDTTKGSLYYDADGAGGQAQILIAALSSHPDLQAGDIVIF
jgi:Ca2+-binding RTX toxin-like protein